MTGTLRIAIVGYGIAGISAAIFLRRLGHEVIHFERAAVPTFGGAGLLLNATGIEMLDRLGLRGPAMLRGAVVSGVYGETLSGSKVMDLRYEDHFAGNLGLGIQRGAMFELLRAADEHAASLQTASPIAAVDARRGYLFDGSKRCLGPFDLIVAADGANSSIRRNLNCLVRHDRLYQWGAIVCLLDDPTGLAGDQVLQRFAGARHVSIWPVGTCGPDAPRRINVSINVPVPRLKCFREPNVWRHHVTELLPRIALLLRQPVDTPDLLSYTYRDVVLRSYYCHRVVFIGDAAHCMSPQLGQGASMGLLDSWALSQSLKRHQDINLALSEFDRQRRAEVSAIQLVSRWITPAFQSESRALALLRDRGLYPLSQLSFVKHAMLKMLSGGREHRYAD